MFLQYRGPTHRLSAMPARVHRSNTSLDIHGRNCDAHTACSPHDLTSFKWLIAGTGVSAFVHDW